MSKVIKDLVHGDIYVNESEKQIIDTPYVQRLRYIKQNSFAFLVYPSATSSRFEHALGVMDLATKFFDNLFDRSRYKKNMIVDAFIDKSREQISYLNLGNKKDTLSFLKCILRLAALLHDVGHFPFSHATEKFFGSLVLSRDVFFLSKFIDYFAEKSHELLTIGIINDSNLIKSRIIKRSLLLLFLADIELPEQKHPVLTQSFQKVTSFLNHSCFFTLKKILSSAIDADRGDYLLRDGRISGSGFGYYDYHRLLFSLRLAYDEQSDRYYPAVSEKGMSVVESFLVGRYQLFKNLCLHKKVLMYNRVLNYLLPSLNLSFEKFFNDDEILNAENYFNNFASYLLNGQNYINILTGSIGDKCFHLDTEFMINYSDNNYLDDYWLLTRIREKNVTSKHMKVLMREKPCVFVWKNFDEFVQIFSKIWSERFFKELETNSIDTGFRRSHYLNVIPNVIFLNWGETPLEKWFSETQKRITRDCSLIWSICSPFKYLADTRSLTIVNKNNNIIPLGSVLPALLKAIERSKVNSINLCDKEVYVWLSLISDDNNINSCELIKHISECLYSAFRTLFINDSDFRKKVVLSLTSEP